MAISQPTCPPPPLTNILSKKYFHLFKWCVLKGNFFKSCSIFNPSQKVWWQNLFNVFHLLWVQAIVGRGCNNCQYLGGAITISTITTNTSYTTSTITITISTNTAILTILLTTTTSTNTTTNTILSTTTTISYSTNTTATNTWSLYQPSCASVLGQKGSLNLLS